MSTLDDLFDSYDPDDEDDFEPRRTACRFCGSRLVYWMTLPRHDTKTGRYVGEQNVMFNDAGGRHECRITAADPDEFDAV